MNYNLSVGTDLDIGGSALFGAPGSFDPADYPNTATSALTDRSLAGLAQTIAPIAAPIANAGTGAAPDWSRWGGSASVSAQDFASAQAMGLLPAGARAPEGQNAYTPELSRTAAIQQAERLMGGAITFARPGETGIKR